MRGRLGDCLPRGCVCVGGKEGRKEGLSGGGVGWD